MIRKKRRTKFLDLLRTTPATTEINEQQKQSTKRTKLNTSSSPSSLSWPKKFNQNILFSYSKNVLMLIILIVINVAILEQIIIRLHIVTMVMASNPYISGIKLPGNQIEDQTLYGEVKSLIGGRAELPCNLTLPSPDDAIQLIFWHRGNNTRVPIYTVDSRASNSLLNATHFLSDVFAPNRAIYDLTTKPSVLRIDPVLETDHSDYRCRVDFRWGRTISSFVSLHVIVPPKKITIRDQNGNYVQNSTIGPYDQNSDVILTCESNGGIPPPTLQWYKNGVMMDGSYVVGQNGIVSNELTIYKLSPHDLYDKYVCQAGNFNSSSSNPIEAYVVLDINLLPIDVRIVTNRTSRLVAGRKVDIRCETYGSKPAAIIKWYRNDKLLSHSIETYESNKTTSLITLMPTVQDNNSLLKCRAYNPRLLSSTSKNSTSSLSSTKTMAKSTTKSTNETSSEKFIETIWKLEVFYNPQVTLRINQVNDNDHHQQENIKESKNKSSSNRIIFQQPTMFKPLTVIVHSKMRLMIECHISANPPLVDVQIFHNSSVIQAHKQLDVQDQNVTKFLIESVDPNHRGRYQCVASNTQGMTRSNPIQLDVLYLPFCKHKPLPAPSQGQTDPTEAPSSKINEDVAGGDVMKLEKNQHYHQYALALNESIRLVCDVDGNPRAIHYYWTLNSDVGWLDEARIIAQSDRDNQLLYTATTSDSYGKLSCWASNDVGIQQDPCSFWIQKAGPPAPLHGCSVTNKTTTSLTIECFSGDNGGSKQIFHAHVYQSVDRIDDEDNVHDHHVDEEEEDEDDQSNKDSRNSAGDSRNPEPLRNKKHHHHHRKQVMVKSQTNLTSETSPIFYLKNLTPGTTYMVELYAKNERGQSDISRLTVTTLFTKNTKLISSSLQEYEYDSWFSVLIGFLLTILLAVVAIYIVCRVRQRQISLKNRRKEEQIKQNFAFRPPNNTMNQSYLNDALTTSIGTNEDKNVIGSKVDNDFLIDDDGKKMATTNLSFGSTTKPDIISFDQSCDPNSKLSLFVIKEQSSSSTAVVPPTNSSGSVVGSLLIGTGVDNGATLTDMSNPHLHTHVSTLFGTPTFLTTNDASAPPHHLAFLAPSNHHCLSPPNVHQSLGGQPSYMSHSSAQPYFISTTGPSPNPETTATILYTPAVQPHILSLNESIDGIVLTSASNSATGDSYYLNDGQSSTTITATSSSATPEATTILLHHPGTAAASSSRLDHPEMSSTDEEICDFNLQQTAV